MVTNVCPPWPASCLGGNVLSSTGVEWFVSSPAMSGWLELSLPCYVGVVGAYIILYPPLLRQGCRNCPLPATSGWLGLYDFLSPVEPQCACLAVGLWVGKLYVVVPGDFCVLPSPTHWYEVMSESIIFGPLHWSQKDDGLQLVLIS